jgi:putative ABC transport system permease protein
VVALQTASLSLQAALISNVRAANGGDISLATEGSPLAASDLRVFRRLQAQGRISAWTAVATTPATAVGDNGALVPFDVNIVGAAYPLGGQPTFVQPSGGAVQRLLHGPQDVLVTSVLADELGIRLGSRLVVNAIGGRGLPVTVRGILAETDFSHASAMTMRDRTGAALTRRPRRYTAVYLDVPAGRSNSVAAGLRTLFPVATIQTVQQSLDETKAETHDFQQFMLLVALLALLTAGIGTFNAIQSLLVRRRLEIAMLKAIGFRQGTLYALFGGEAVVIGLAGGVLGTLVGVLISRTVTDVLAQAMALQVPYVLDGGTVLEGVAVGLGSTLAFALLPIVRAADFRPIEMLRYGEELPAGARWLQTSAVVGTVLVLFVVLAAALLGDLVLAAQLVLGAAAALIVLGLLFAASLRLLSVVRVPRSPLAGWVAAAVLLALTVAAIVRSSPFLGPLLLADALWLAVLLLRGTRLLPLTVAIRSLQRRPVRTSVTLVAFFIGVLAMALSLTIARGLQSEISAALSRNGTNLVLVTDPSGSTGAERAVHRLSGVKTATAQVVVSTRPIAVNGEPLSSVGGGADSSGDPDRPGRMLGGVTGLNLRQGQGVAGIRLVAGRYLGPRDAGTNHVLVNAGLQSGPPYLRLGDTVQLKEAGTGRTGVVRVVGFYTRPFRRRSFSSFFLSPILGDRALAMRLGGPDAQVVMSLGINPDLLAHDATTLQNAVPGALVIDIGNLTAIIDRILGELLDVLAVITAISLGAGVAVVGNGVALAMLERRREIALYKSIGFRPGDVLGFVLVENALVGGLAGALSILAAALALDLISHFALQTAVPFDPAVSVAVVLTAALLAVVTAYVAGRRPIGVRPLETLRND